MPDQVEAVTLQRDLHKSLNYDMVASLITAGAFLIAFMILSFKIGSCTDWQITIPIFLASLAVGWTLGIFISPYGAAEQKDFATYGKAISVFLSGYVVARLDQELGKDSIKPFLTEVNILRICGSFVLIISAAVVVFTARRYSQAKGKVVTAPSAPAK